MKYTIAVNGNPINDMFNIISLDKAVLRDYVEARKHKDKLVRYLKNVEIPKAKTITAQTSLESVKDHYKERYKVLEELVRTIEIMEVSDVDV